MDKFPITQQGYDKLEQEIKQLKIKVQELEQVIEGYRFKLIG